ncbi:hypothetical protein ACKWTF_000803 [Chironomus riparius]
MECEDKSMERQKLVQNDEEEDVTLPTSVTTQSKTPISPANVYSGSDSHSQSLGKTSSEAKLSFVNERKTIEIENARKASVERKKKMLKGFQDVKNMEKNLISLLDDFHNGEYRFVVSCLVPKLEGILWLLISDVVKFQARNRFLRHPRILFKN